MTKQYNGKKLNLDFDELDAPKRRFNNDNDGLYRAQEIVSPYQVEGRRREKNFSSPKRKYYKRDKDFTPEERSKILARVSEVGATRAADEFGTRRWVIMQWLDNLEKFGAIDHPKHKNKKIKNKNRNFPEKNSAPKKFSDDIKVRKEEKIEAEIPDFKNFKFNFDGIISDVSDVIEQDEQDKQPVKTQEQENDIPLRIKKKTSNDFTLEERDKILKLSYEIGIKKAALQVHTKVDVIKYWRKLSKKASKAQNQHVDPLVAENKILKDKILELKGQIKELTEKILLSIKTHEH